jgi:hypothetical protein
MNSKENKGLLWNTILEQNGFKEGISLERTKDLFEKTLLKYTDTKDNSVFLSEFISLLHQEPMDPKQYHESLEKRMIHKQETYKYKPPTEELHEIKKLLYMALDKLERIS